ncbi:MAG: hypothetical protein R2724_26110 [Bryobacterales bacterium]
MAQDPQLSDLLLKAFLMRRQLLLESGFTGARVIGSRFSKDTHRIREFFSRHRVPFTWIDLEKDPDVHVLLHHFGVSPSDTPVVVCGAGKMIRNPSNAQLADHTGIRKPLDHVVHDLVIVGAGPADWPPPSMARRRACGPSCWTASALAARPGRARRSKTTWDSRRGCRAPSWRTALFSRLRSLVRP